MFQIKPHKIQYFSFLMSNFAVVLNERNSNLLNTLISLQNKLLNSRFHYLHYLHYITALDFAKFACISAHAGILLTLFAKALPSFVRFVRTKFSSLVVG